MTGYAEGGFTPNGTTLTTVGERGTEFVAPNWMVRENPVIFQNLESYRRARSHGRSGSVRRGFAEGGFTAASKISASSIAPLGIDMEQALYNAFVRAAGEGYIRAYVVRRDIKELDAQDERFHKQTSR